MDTRCARLSPLSDAENKTFEGDDGAETDDVGNR
jgi:hypothetical protein